MNASCCGGHFTSDSCSDGEAMVHLQYCTCAGQIYADVSRGVNKEPPFVQFKQKTFKMISCLFFQHEKLLSNISDVFGSVNTFCEIVRFTQEKVSIRYFQEVKDTKTAVYSEICSNVASYHAKQNVRSETKMAARFISSTEAKANVLSGNMAAICIDVSD